MKQRLISAAVMLLIGVPLLVAGGLFSTIFLFVILLLIDYEIARLSSKFSPLVFISAVLFDFFYFFSNLEEIAIVFLVVLLFISAFFNKEFNASYVGCSFLMIIMCALAIDMALLSYSIHNLFIIYVAGAPLICDAGAYFVGRKFGKHKLCERISPKKTIEGAVGGAVISFVITFIFAFICGYFNLSPIIVIVLCILLPIVSEFGDLAFSLIKRYFNLKDFSNIIPGHGGLLDRFDSSIFCLLFMYLIIIFIL